MAMQHHDLPHEGPKLYITSPSSGNNVSLVPHANQPRMLDGLLSWQLVPRVPPVGELAPDDQTVIPEACAAK